MAVVSVQEDGGGAYDNLFEALDTETAGATFEIEGEWDNPDTVNVVIPYDTTIECIGPALHAGKYDAAAKHYRLVESGADHALSLNGAFTATITGLVIEQAGTTSSAECFRCTPGTADTVTLKNCILHNTGNASSQDGIYTGFNISIGDITLEQCQFTDHPRGGINSENGDSSNESATLNINSCAFAGCGDVTEGGGILVDRGNSSSTITVNVQNTYCLDCNTQASSEDYHASNSFAAGVVWNISNSMDSDGSIATHIDTGAANNPDGGTWTLTQTDEAATRVVIVTDYTTQPYDLSLIDSDNQDNEDLHSDDEAHGLTIPTTDLAGVTREQGLGHEIGPFEISVASATLTITGTVQDSADEDDFTAGGKQAIYTLGGGETWVPA